MTSNELVPAFLNNSRRKITVELGPDAPCVAVVSREQWGSTAEQKLITLTKPVDYVFVHHTAGDWDQTTNQTTCSSYMRGIQKYHIQERGWDDIGYTFVIGGDGRIYEGRGWGRVGAHTYKYNDVGYGISLMGNFCEQPAPEEMLASLKNIITAGVEQGFIKSDYGLYGHSDARVTLCPGEVLYNTLSSWDHWHSKGIITKHEAAS